MRRLLLLAVAMVLPVIGSAQGNWVTRDSVVTILSNTDTDTLFFLFPVTRTPERIGRDTTVAGTRAYIPPKFTYVGGDFDLWLDRTNLAGAADSFRVYYFPLHPYTGDLAKNDSTFILGGTSTFASFVSRSHYFITVPTTPGIGIVVRQGDLVAARTRLRATLVFSQ